MRPQQAGDGANSLAAFSHLMDGLLKVFVRRGVGLGNSCCLLNEHAPESYTQLLVFL
jgi:hypothetical protein